MNDKDFRLRGALYAAQVGLCIYTHVPLSPFSNKNRLTINHIVPVSNGGKHNHNNLVLCAMSAGSSKGKKSLEQYCIDKVIPYDNLIAHIEFIHFLVDRMREADSYNIPIVAALREVSHERFDSEKWKVHLEFHDIILQQMWGNKYNPLQRLRDASRALEIHERLYGTATELFSFDGIGNLADYEEY